MQPGNTINKKRILSLAILVIVALVIVFLLSRIHTKSVVKVQQAKQTLAQNSTLTQISQIDSNGNGIPDWEETLYGLNPNGDGASNKAIIDQKQAALAAENPPESAAAPDETDTFSQEFFSSILALQQQNDLTPDAVTALTASIAQKMNSESQTKYTTAYTLADIHAEKTESASADVAYLKALRALVIKYQAQNIGVESESIDDALSTSDPRPLLPLDLIATAYTNFAKDLASMQAPPSFVQTQFTLVVSTDEMGKSLPDIKQILSNSLVALPALAVYEKEYALFTNTLNSITAKY